MIGKYSLLSSVAVASTLLISVAAAQSPELIVEIERREIYEGESVIYRITLNHIQNPTPPILDGFDDFDVVPMGEQSLNSQQVTIINGRRSEVVRRGRQYNYRLTPRRSGTLTIPAPTATVGNDVLTGTTVSLRVIPPEVQDDVLLEISVDRDVVYPMQPFVVTLVIAVKDLPGDFGDRDPLSVQPHPPVLSIPWMDDAQIAEGIKPDSDWQQLLQPLMSRSGGGVQINNIGSSSVFSLFDNQATAFHPKPVRKTRVNSDGDDVGYWEFRFQRKFIPQRTGTYSFGPVTLKGTFATNDQRGQLVGEAVYAVARPVSVRVRHVPVEGRPASWIGAVGSFHVTATMVPVSARLGDPITLTLTIAGDGALQDAWPPDIAALPEVNERFRSYDATQQTQAGSLSFTWSLRPLVAGVTEFPAIPVTFFDVDSESYRTVTTTPIPLTIRDAETLSNKDIVADRGKDDPARTALQTSQDGIFANDSALSSFTDDTVRPVRWLVVWGSMLGTYAMASFVLLRSRRRRQDPAWLRRRSAVTRARTALQAAAAKGANEGDGLRCESLRRAVAGLVADFVDVDEGSLTPREAAEHLRTLGVAEEYQIAVQRFLDDCDSARYGAGSTDLTTLAESAEALVEQLAKTLQSVTRTRRTLSTAASATLLMTIVIQGCQQVPDMDLSRQFDECETAFAAAVSEEDFAHVAAQYQQIIDAGVHSGAVYFNQGNAWMRADAPGRAIASYRLAQRYRPRDPYVAANLQAALTECHSAASVESETGIAGYVLFWQNWLSYPEKLWAATVVLAGVLVVMFVGILLEREAVSRKCLYIGIPVFAVLIASAGWDWARFDQTDSGVVVVDQSIARKGNSDSYEPAFTQPLSEGTEFQVIERRGDWLHAHFDNQKTGWLMARDTALY
jgi:BatD DUF11 like domain